MENKEKIAIVIGFMFFILTCGVCIQIKTIKSTTIGKISSNYEENNLRAEVLKYKERYEDLLKETEKVDAQLNKEIEKAAENDDELVDAKNKIEEGNKIIGLTDVTGPGVTIIVRDSDADNSKILNANDAIVHDKDILKIVNELKNAGAEAISVNNQRLIITTPIYCGGNIININGERIGSPFEIKAIGLPETLANLQRPGGTLSDLNDRGVIVSLKKENNITIPKYNGVFSFKYLK